MRYTALILKGYKRFALNQIETFTIRPSEQIQLILGTNGSGKSSLLQEMSPLPANKDDYLKDIGSKEIHIYDRGHNYILGSNFANKQIHSFQKDGEELNPGGTGAVQKELCRSEFGITPDTQELTLGYVRFTAMGPSLRREWFTQLSDVSYDYAINVYNKLREEYRNVNGALKLDKKQLVVEQSRIISEEEQQLLIADVKSLHQDLEQLLEMKQPIDKSVEQLELDRAKAERILGELSGQLLRLKVESPSHMYRDDWGVLQPLVFHSIEDVQNHIDDVREQIAAQEAVMSKMVSDHGKLKETVEILKKRGADGVESLRAKIRDASDRRMEQLKATTLKLDFTGHDVRAALKTLDSIHLDLVVLMQELPSNESKMYSSTLLLQFQDARDTLKRFLQQKQHELAVLQGKKQHADEHREKGAVTCPKCKFSFLQGLNDAQYDAVLKRIPEIVAEIEGTEKNLKKTEELITQQENYGRIYREFIQLTRSTPTLKPFWSFVAEKGYATNAPSAIANQVSALFNDLHAEIKALGINEEIVELKKLLAQSEELGDTNITEAMEKLNNNTVEVEALTKTLAKSRRDLNEFHVYRKQLQEAISLRSQIDHAGELYEQLTYDAVEALRRTVIEQCFRQTQSTLARKEEILNGVKQQRAIVENLAQTIVRRTKEEEALKASVRALSPTDGLIAEGLLGFIRNFTHQMNQLIRKIWAYPLEVMPCGMANERGAELDYKFPLMVSTKDNVVRDVSIGSSGMQEIVDLAFKVIAMKYLHLEHGALILDEFGKTFDLEHQTSAVMAIKALMETKQFTQLFMISHYSAHYGAFTNAEVCVLDARNIAVPKVHNTHVTIN